MPAELLQRPQPRVRTHPVEPQANPWQVRRVHQGSRHLSRPGQACRLIRIPTKDSGRLCIQVSNDYSAVCIKIVLSEPKVK